MAKATLANKLPRRAEKNLQIVGEQIRLARLRRDLSIAQRCGISTAEMTRFAGRFELFEFSE